MWFYIGGMVGVFLASWADFIKYPIKSQSFTKNVLDTTFIAFWASVFWPIAIYIWINTSISETYEVKSKFKIGIKKVDK